MSHFTLGVIVHPTDDIDEAIDSLLAPFNENTPVDPYPTDCYCRGSIARIAATDYAEKVCGRWRAIQDKDLRQSYYETQDDYERYHPAYGLPDPVCDECHGTGISMSTYNKASKWDWYRVGGRWDRCLPNGENKIKVADLLVPNISRRPIEPEPGNFYDFFLPDYQQRLAEYESAPVDVRDLYAPFALLTSDGKWYEKGDMGWFGMVSNEQYADHTLVLVDCHI